MPFSLLTLPEPLAPLGLASSPGVVLGSLLITVSDCLLSFRLFKVLPTKILCLMGSLIYAISRDNSASP